MLADVKAVSKHVLILWHEEISTCADASENESYEGKIESKALVSIVLIVVEKIFFKSH